MIDQPRFLFVTCQVHAEPALKREVKQRHAGLRFAYSRPGFVTFKLADDCSFADDFDLDCTFARSHAFSLGKSVAESADQRVQEIWSLAGERPLQRLQVWPRDLYSPGYKDFEPGLTEESRAAAALIWQQRPPHLSGLTDDFGPANPGEQVLDVVLVSEREWWVGVHQVHSRVSGWPGGMLPDALPAEAVSRGYLKMHEALLWSDLPLRPGQRCVEIGSSPGGSSQALLQRGVSVVGIDPAEMHPTLLDHPQFTHVRARAKEVKRSLFSGCDWLTVDINLPPKYTLDTVQGILQAPGVRLKGVLMTLKLGDWELAKNIPEYLKRARSWGIGKVSARQLQHNRQEICVMLRR